MKKRILFPILILVLSLALALPMATPAMAEDSGLSLNLTANPAEVSPGGTSDILVELLNISGDALYDVTVTLSAPINQTLGPVFMAIGETKTWTVTTPAINGTTTVTAYAEGRTVEDGWFGYRVCSDASVQITVGTPPGDEGLTPGYWKNHLDDWGATGLSPADDFDTTFGVDLFDPDITLDDAVNMKGNAINSLVRHATAALLNATHPDVDYPLTAAEVIAIVQAALSPGGDVKAAKNILAGFNELGG